MFEDQNTICSKQFVYWKHGWEEFVFFRALSTPFCLYCIYEILFFKWRHALYRFRCLLETPTETLSFRTFSAPQSLRGLSDFCQQPGTDTYLWEWKFTAVEVTKVNKVLNADLINFGEGTIWRLGVILSKMQLLLSIFWFSVFSISWHETKYSSSWRRL